MLVGDGRLRSGESRGRAAAAADPASSVATDELHPSATPSVVDPLVSPPHAQPVSEKATRCQGGHRGQRLPTTGRARRVGDPLDLAAEVRVVEGGRRASARRLVAPLAEQAHTTFSRRLHILIDPHPFRRRRARRPRPRRSRGPSRSAGSARRRARPRPARRPRRRSSRCRAPCRRRAGPSGLAGSNSDLLV